MAMLFADAYAPCRCMKRLRLYLTGRYDVEERHNPIVRKGSRGRGVEGSRGERQKTGDRRQKTGDRRQETGNDSNS